MNVCVIGGTGFIGRYIVQALVRAGHSVAVVARSPRRASAITQLAGTRAVEGDVTDPSSLGGKLAGADAVVYAIGFPNYPMELPRKGHTFHRYEVGGTLNVLDEAGRAGITRYLYISGAGADPASAKPWYRAKGLAEEAIRRSGLDYLLLRPSWAYGREDRALNQFVAIARRSPVIPMFAPRRPQRIQPVYIEDVGLTVARAFERDHAWARAIELGGREVMTMRDVIETMLRVLGKRRLIVPVPVSLAKLATAPLVALPKPPMTPGGVEFASQDGLVDTEEVEALLGIRPRPLEEGLRRYLVS